MLPHAVLETHKTVLIVICDPPSSTRTRTQVMDANSTRISQLPDACFNTKDRKLNISGT
jgi:hypothetical protein